MKHLIFQLRRPFRSGHFLNSQRRVVQNLAINRAVAFENNLDMSIEEMDDYWYYQNQHVLHDQQELRDEEELQRDSLSSSSLTSVQNQGAGAAFEGAYEGILSILDDPRKQGARFFCRHRLETNGDFVHREDLSKRVQEVDAVSERDSVMHHSYVDSV